MTTTIERPAETPEATPRPAPIAGIVWMVIPILLVAFALRLVRLGEQNIWWDEGLAFWAVRKDLLGATLWTAGDVHPPVFFWLLWSQVRLAGDSEFAARLVGVYSGVLTVALAVPLGKLLGGWRVAIGAALLLAVARFPVWWSQELRMYAPATMFALAATYFAVKSTRGGRWWLGYVISASLAVWTLYLAAAVLIAHNLYVGIMVLGRLIRRGPSPVSAGRLFLLWSAAQMTVGAVFIGWLVFASERMRTWSTAEPVDPWLFLRLFPIVTITGVSTDIDRYWPAVLYGVGALILAGLIGFGIGRGRRTFAPGWLAVALAALIVPAFVFYATQPRALFYSPRLEVRYFLLAAPFVALLAAGALAAFGRIGWPVWALGTVAVAGLLTTTTVDYLQERHHWDEYDSMVQTLNAYARPDDGVVLVSGDRSVIFDYYYLDRVTAQGPRYNLPFTIPADAESAAGDIAPIADMHRRIWLVSAEAHLQDPGKHVQAWLDANRPKVLDQAEGYNHIALYDRAGEPPTLERIAPQAPLNLDLGGGRQLLGYDLPATRLFPNDTGHAALYWRSGGGDAGPIAIRLVDESGVPLEEWVYSDQDTPKGQTVRRQVEFAVYPHTPAGTYSLFVETESTKIRLAGVTIERTTAPELPPSDQLARPAQPFGDSMRLVGYTLTANGRTVAPGATVRPGDELKLTVVWEPQARPNRSWVGFAHLLGEAINPASNNQIWGQADGYPLKGTFPTEQWRPGTAVPDTRVMTIDPNAPAGTYQIEVGFYWPDSGERLPTADGAGRMILQNVTVQP